MITTITAIAPKIVSKNIGFSKYESPVFVKPILKRGIITIIEIIRVIAPDKKSRSIQLN